MNKRKLVIANWKMNPVTRKESQNLFSQGKRTALKLKSTQVVICPPFIYLSILAGKGFSRYELGAQDVFWIGQGAYTGETSPLMLTECGVKYVIVGHSERRALGEDNQTVARKIHALLHAGITPVVCVGETDRDTSGLFLSILEEQIKESLQNIPRQKISRIILAYEPVWAIGKKAADAMKAQDLHETILFVRKVISKLYGRKIALTLSILYGGSAEPENVGELLHNGGINGFLVGHVSLSAENFTQLLKTVDAV